VAQAGDPGSWQTVWSNTLAPTNTSAGIFVQASSTIDGDLRVAEHFNVGTTTAWDQYGMAIATTTILDANATTTKTVHLAELGLNNEYLTDLTGTGLQNTAGSLGVANTNSHST
jgi:hypothetical protein